MDFYNLKSLKCPCLHKWGPIQFPPFLQYTCFLNNCIVKSLLRFHREQNENNTWLSFDRFFICKIRRSLYIAISLKISISYPALFKIWKETVHNTNRTRAKENSAVFDRDCKNIAVERAALQILYLGIWCMHLYTKIKDFLFILFFNFPSFKRACTNSLD